MRKNWYVRPCSSALQKRLSKTLGISPTLARILINRKLTDVKDAHEFIYGDMSSCHDPFLLKDMDRAVARIKNAVAKKEKILIYGDYDVDGITSVALLKIVLDELGALTAAYIPNRMDEGYGLNMKAVKFAGSSNVKLIITADCGIGAIEEVRLANSLGIDVVITDHHEIKGEEMPRAYAIINPHQEDCTYPFKHLAGVGIAYKLAKAVTRKRFYNMEEHLDLVALGTVADIAPQWGENRILTKYGLSVLNRTGKIGLRSLIAASGLAKRDISASHIGYVLGPRINAMGRVGSADIALNLFLTDNKLEADNLAARLNKENRTRQKIEATILEEAISKVEREINFKECSVIVLAEEGWHSGVIGIVASRIKEKYYRPSIMIALKGGLGKGSGRSIDKFHLFEALLDSQEHLVNFGGHEAACGLVIQERDLDKFRAKINDYAKKNIKEEDLSPTIKIDIDMPISNVNRELIRELELLKPHGPKNPKPLFLSSELLLRDEPRLIGKNGFKVWLRDKGVACEAITFKKHSINMPKPGEIIDIVYRPSINSWQGIESIQLDLSDIRVRGKFRGL